MTATYDPERRLWVPGRRRFLLLSGLAMAGTVLGVKAASQPEELFGFPVFYRDDAERTWRDLQRVMDSEYGYLVREAHTGRLVPVTPHEMRLHLRQSARRRSR